jgi:chemotaxis protein methyltransferase CheR
MTTSVVERFRAAIASRLGLWFDDTRLEFLGEALASLAGERGASACVDRLEAGTTPRAERRALAAALTIGETYFFRHIEQLDALRDVAFPAIARARGEMRRIRMLSAGCASGEEPYSLAIAAHDYFGGLSPAWQLDIRGLDVNASALTRAREGRYSRWSLRDAPTNPATRWLHASGNGLVLAPEIRAMVDFVEGNLVDDDPIIWQPHSYDVVFCRNVLMYFAPEQARRIVTRMVASLAPGGWLFLGHAESLRGLGAGLELCHTHGTFYYRRSPDPAPAPSQLWMHGDPTATADSTTTWFDAIDTATSRVRTLLGAPDADSEEVVMIDRAAQPEPDVPAEADLAAAVDMLQRERYADALAVVDALPEPMLRVPRARLLRAVLLTHCGRLDEAEDACRELLQSGDGDADAHYLLALCAERRGDLTVAANHDRSAMHIDAGFAMPRLHLGLMARRRGDLDAARRELAQALALIQEEPASRLLLFAGGFGRDALLAIAKSELLACGGRS